jgi:hypothetical protein
LGSDKKAIEMTICMRTHRAGPAALLCVLVLALLPFGNRARAEDPIVGTWVGNVIQQGQDPFETRLTFVSPRGGVSRYPSYPCGGMLAGGRKGAAYEYQETINWGGMDEQANGYVGGIVRLSVDGDTMKFDWSTNYNGQDYQASGELHRQK